MDPSPDFEFRQSSSRMGALSHPTMLQKLALALPKARAGGVGGCTGRRGG